MISFRVHCYSPIWYGLDSRDHLREYHRKRKYLHWMYEIHLGDVCWWSFLAIVLLLL